MTEAWMADTEQQPHVCVACVHFMKWSSDYCSGDPDRHGGACDASGIYLVRDNTIKDRLRHPMMNVVGQDVCNRQFKLDPEKLKDSEVLLVYRLRLSEAATRRARYGR